MLLHDTGKGGVGGQEKAGARAARQACERLGLERSKIELVAWLVEHHLVMSDFAQKRDVADPATVAAFAQHRREPRAAAPAAGADGRRHPRGRARRLERLEGPADARALRRHRDGVPRRADVGRRRNGAAPAGGDGLRCAHRPGRGRSGEPRLGDRHGGRLLRRLRRRRASRPRPAGPRGGGARRRLGRGPHPRRPQRRRAGGRRAGPRGSVRRPRPGDRQPRRQRGGRAHLHLQPRRGARRLLCAGRVGRAVRAASTRACWRGWSRRWKPPRSAGAPALEAKKPDLGRAAAFTIAPAVSIDNDASADATVIEASGRDRPGLLAALARILAEAELSIQSAHVDNYGERAVDAFYVVTRQGKLTEPHRAAAVRARLLEALEDAELAAARPRLERARASARR